MQHFCNTFDYFGELSHPDNKEGLTDEQYNNRMILREAMTKFGFRPLETEWFYANLLISDDRFSFGTMFGNLILYKGKSNITIKSFEPNILHVKRQN